MTRVSAEQRTQTESRIRAASDRLLKGDIPAGSGCDVKTLAAEAGVARAVLYTTYRHLKDEFETRRDRARDAGEFVDHRQVQITNLTQQTSKLRERIDEQKREIAQLKVFRQTAVSRLASQHDEILRLREALASHTNVLGLNRHETPSTDD